MAERKGRGEAEKDRGTKAEHGIGREDEGMGDRGTKAGLGGDDNADWLKDPNVKSADVDVGPMRQIDPEQHAERPIWQEPKPTERESVPDTDPAAVVGPDYQDGPESIDADTDDGDWDDDAPEMEADVDIDDDEDEEDE